jgi:hypothetical protein
MLSPLAVQPANFPGPRFLRGKTVNYPLTCSCDTRQVTLKERIETQNRKFGPKLNIN